MSSKNLKLQCGFLSQCALTSRLKPANDLWVAWTGLVAPLAPDACTGVTCTSVVCGKTEWKWLCQWNSCSFDKRNSADTQVQHNTWRSDELRCRKTNVI